MIYSVLPKRGTDDFGSGEFGAKRGGKAHRGVDYAAPHGAKILAPETGKITKLGYAYEDDLSFRYVQITVSNGDMHRLFYVEPKVEIGQRIIEGEEIGIAQDIAGRYNDKNKTMINHVHYEVKLPTGGYRNPEL